MMYTRLCGALHQWCIHVYLVYCTNDVYTYIWCIAPMTYTRISGVLRQWRIHVDLVYCANDVYTYIWCINWPYFLYTSRIQFLIECSLNLVKMHLHIVNQKHIFVIYLVFTQWLYINLAISWFSCKLLLAMCVFVIMFTMTSTMYSGE